MKQYLLIPLTLLLLAACAEKQAGWSLSGELPADVKSVTLELPSPAGGWYTADSVAVNDAGEFVIKRERANGEMYRLNIDGKYVYVPADSTEALGISMSQEGNYVITGSHEAALFSDVSAILDAPADSTTSRRLLMALQDDFGSTAAYYANLRLHGKNRTLLRAVANAYSNLHPDDPRTALLLAQLKNSTPSSSTGETVVIEAPELGYFDIELLDRKGTKTALSSVVDSHMVTLLAFVNLAAETAPAVNICIGEACTAYPQIGVYEVGFGENQHQWANATAELPWVNVFQSESASQTHLGQYAVNRIPTFFVIKNDEIVERIDDATKIKDTVRKHI